MTAIGIYLSYLTWKNRKTWDKVNILCTLAVVTLVLHVIEEWVFPGGLHYSYNIAHGSELLSRYPMNRLTDMITNFGAVVLGCVVLKVWGFRKPAAIAVMLFSFFEVFIHVSIGIQDMALFAPYGMNTLYSPGLITSLFGFLPIGLGLLIHFCKKENRPKLRQWVMAVAGTAVLCFLLINLPEMVLGNENTPYEFTDRGYGSLEGYRRISSKEKWLRIHNTGEWDDYYNKAHTEELRKFFDRYLKGENNGWESTPKVRVSILNPGGEDIVGRVEEDWPIPRTRYRKLYLNGEENSLQPNPVAGESWGQYNSDRKKSGISISMKMPEDREICGYMKLRLWVEALDHDDMDLCVKLEKRRPSGLKYKYTLGPGMDTAAKGYIRASLRALDEARSTEENPRQSMAKEEKLRPGQIVPVDILIWPMGLKLKKGDILRVTVSPYKTVKMWTGPFQLKMAKITIPKEGYTYFPEEKPEMVTIGGGEMFAGSKVSTTQLPKDHNKGRHRIYTGGKYDSCLYLPVLPRSQ